MAINTQGDTAMDLKAQLDDVRAALKDILRVQWPAVRDQTNANATALRMMTADLEQLRQAVNAMGRTLYQWHPTVDRHAVSTDCPEVQEAERILAEGAR